VCCAAGDWRQRAGLLAGPGPLHRGGLLLLLPLRCRCLSAAAAAICCQAAPLGSAGRLQQPSAPCEQLRRSGSGVQQRPSAQQLVLWLPLPLPLPRAAIRTRPRRPLLLSSSPPPPAHRTADLHDVQAARQHHSGGQPLVPAAPHGIPPARCPPARCA
jgi:hypothetical protein